MQIKVLLIVFLPIFLLVESSVAAETVPIAAAIPTEDYALYDQVVTEKFLTSGTRLVVIERMTVSRLLPNQGGLMTNAFFQEQRPFKGALPPDLVRDFVWFNRRVSRLEGRFQFGVRYRFVSGQDTEELEAMSALPVKSGHAGSTLVSSVLDRLAFSRVGRTLRNDGALLYVENMRPNGTGAGFLVWFRQQEEEWKIFETEVLWIVRDEQGPEETP